jgi:hypothetical protein
MEHFVKVFAANESRNTLLALEQSRFGLLEQKLIGSLRCNFDKYYLRQIKSTCHHNCD